MARYKVSQAYQAFRDGQSFGRWEPDIEVELSEEDAAWVNRDSPGTLTPATSPAPKAEPAEVELPGDEQERQAKPARDRQQRSGRNRAT